MDRGHGLGLVLVGAGVALVGLGFLTQSCPSGRLSGPTWFWPLAPANPLNCTRPALSLALLFWLPAAALIQVRVVLYRRAHAR